MQFKNRNRAWDKTPEAAAYRQQYRDAHYTRIEIAVTETKRNEIDERAKAAGISRTAYILAAVEEYMKKG